MEFHLSKMMHSDQVFFLIKFLQVQNFLKNYFNNIINEISEKYDKLSKPR